MQKDGYVRVGNKWHHHEQGKPRKSSDFAKHLFNDQLFHRIYSVIETPTAFENADTYF